jgi:hypothetical protein
MATATIQVTAGGDTMTRTCTVSRPDLIRFIAAIRVAYNIDPLLSDLQALEVWADVVFDQARTTTRVVERAAASDAVTSIDFTP